MTVITLTGHLGSMGTIAARTAEQLGYTLADRELLIESAQTLGWSEAEVAAFDERTGGQGGRLGRLLRDFLEHAQIDDLDISGLGNLVGSSYQDTASAPELLPPDRRYISVLSALVRDLAERDDVVIVGRGGQALLAGRPDIVHVRVVCPFDERVRRIAERDRMAVEAARTRVQDSDRQREAWHQKYFGISYESPYLYHAVVNSGRLSDEQASDLVIQIARAKAPLAEARRGQTGGRVAGGGRQDWGWIELLHPERTGEPLARAHLFATEVAEDGAWQGELESVRLLTGSGALADGPYFARFALSQADHTVTLSLKNGEVLVTSDDVDVPAIFRERSSG